MTINTASHYPGLCDTLPIRNQLLYLSVIVHVSHMPSDNLGYKWTNFDFLAGVLCKKVNYIPPLCSTTMRCWCCLQVARWHFTSSALSQLFLSDSTSQASVNAPQLLWCLIWSKSDCDLLISGASNFNAQMMNQALTVQSVVLRMEIIWNAHWYAWVVEKYTNFDFS